MNNVQKLIAISVTAFTAASTTAHAGGFLADTFIKPFNPELARQADRLNHELGNPVDHTIARGADALVPGTGTALETGWAIQRSGVLNGINPPGAVGNPPGGMRPIPTGMPPMMGNRCMTPIGVFGPGPFQPVGAGCHTMTFQGPVFGQIIQ